MEHAEHVDDPRHAAKHWKKQQNATEKTEHADDQREEIREKKQNVGKGRLSLGDMAAFVAQNSGTKKRKARRIFGLRLLTLSFCLRTVNVWEIPIGLFPSCFHLFCPTFHAKLSATKSNIRNG